MTDSHAKIAAALCLAGDYREHLDRIAAAVRDAKVALAYAETALNAPDAYKAHDLTAQLEVSDDAGFDAAQEIDRALRALNALPFLASAEPRAQR